MVNIKNVYDTVLFIINKENRGYITKDEFNSLARQAQLEIFESYFTKQALSLQGVNNSDYSNPYMNIEEKITFFDNTSAVSKGTNGRYNYNDLPETFYRLGTVILDNRIVDEVNHNELPYINLSPLTAPTNTQPVYTRHEGGIAVYPTSYSGAISMVYTRRPNDPELRGVVVNSTFQDVGSANFDLHPSEEHELVIRILSYSGIIIRDTEIIQIAAAKEQQLNNNEQ